MAVIVFSQPVPFPIAPLREMLGKYFPSYKWQCGENDTGGREQMGSFSPSDIIIGRSGGDSVMVPLKACLGSYSASAPPHDWHLEIGNPTTENRAFADRIVVLIASILMIADEHRAHCELVPGGGWLTPRDLVDSVKLVGEGASLADVGARAGPGATSPKTGTARYEGLPPERAMALAQMDESMATMLHEMGMGDHADRLGLSKAPDFAHEMPRADALPTMVLLAKSPLFFDWPLIRDGLNAIDAAGDWTVEPSGPSTAVVRGRGATVTIKSSATALPGYLISQGLSREHNLTPEARSQVESHRVHHAICIDLDTRDADFIDVRQTAKAVTMLIALAAKHPDFCGLFNAGCGLAMGVDRVHNGIGALAGNEVPIALWTWMAVDSAVPDAISLSTGGMRPFVGYEVECSNAPGELSAIGERFSGVLRYLLINGPVIKPGETIGDTTEDRSTRCFFGDSMVDRFQDEPVPVMLLEFDNNGGLQPQPDAAVTQPGHDGTDPLAALRPQPTPASPKSRPVPDDDGKTRVFSKSLFEGRHGELLRSAGMSPDDPGNILPTPEDHRRQIEASRVAMSRRCDAIETEMRAHHGHGIVRPYFILGEATMQGRLGNFVMLQLDLLPYDDWNMVALAKDDRTADLTGLPLHPGAGLDDLERRGCDFVTEVHQRYRATMESVDPHAPDFLDRLRELDVGTLHDETRSAIIEWTAQEKPRLIAMLSARAQGASAPARPVFGRKAAGGFGRKGL